MWRRVALGRLGPSLVRSQVRPFGGGGQPGGAWSGFDLELQMRAATPFERKIAPNASPVTISTERLFSMIHGSIPGAPMPRSTMRPSGSLHGIVAITVASSRTAPFEHLGRLREVGHREE